VKHVQVAKAIEDCRSAARRPEALGPGWQPCTISRLPAVELGGHPNGMHWGACDRHVRGSRAMAPTEQMNARHFAASAFPG
jgi:hypothetical protein